MRSPVFWRRSSTAAGVYLSAALGFLGSVVAFRELGTYDFGLLALVLAATGFFQLFADLTVDEAVIKYGFRYQAREDWGRFRRVFGIGISLKLAGGLLGAVGIAILAPLSHLIWAHGLAGPMLVAALLPITQAPEGIAAAASSSGGATKCGRPSSWCRWRFGWPRSPSARPAAGSRPRLLSSPLAGSPPGRSA